MKKYFLTMVIGAAFIATATHAQIQKGNVLIGGDLANINLGLNKPNVFSIDIMPKVGWFVQDNLALGGYVHLGLQTAKASNTVTTYGVGALGRYYTGSDVDVLRHGRIFGEATFGVGGTNVSDGGGSTNGIDFGFGPGFAYFVTPNIGLETLVKYNGLGGFGNVSYQSSLTLTFGLQIYLPGAGTARKVRRDVK